MAEDVRRALVEVVARALEIPPESRDRFLAEACGGDAAMQAEARSLIEAAGGASGFLGGPTRQVGIAAAPVGPGEEGPGAMIGRYRLLEQIGEGGFGVVFMAEQREPVQRRVALKIIKLGMDTRAVVARFEAERQALALMDHPNIARVLDGGATPSGRPYFVMELVRGEPIDTFCDARRLTTDQRLDLFIQVCQAVQHAHSKGIIHRDLKPGNVLVSEIDGRPVPKVIDFGIAKATSARLTEKTLFTEFRQMIGTPAYMSPEQAGSAAGDVDTRTDVYSLGVLLYELLTGATPFDAARLRSAAWGELQRMIREEDPPRPSTRLSTMKDRLPSVAALRHTEPARLTECLRGDLDWIVMRCLEKDRTRRYPTADALADDLRRHLRSEAVAAAPPSAAYRIRKFVRRHRFGVGAGAGVLLALVAGLVATAYGLVRAVRAEHLAVERLMQTEQARAEAVEAKERAERFNRIANAVTEFFTHDLLDLRPTPAGGREITVREVLDAVPPKIDRYFKDEPAVEGIIRERVGQLYRRIGQLQRSTEYLVQAIPLLEAGLGPDHKQTLSAIHRLGELHMDLQQHERAEQLFDRAYQGRLRAHGTEYTMTWSSLTRRGTARVLIGRVDEGLADVRAAVANAEQVFGRRHRNYIVAARGLAGLLREVGKPDEARAMLTDLLGTVLEEKGNLAIFEWALRSDLTLALIDLDRGPEAVEQADRVMTLLAATYPPNHQTFVDGRLHRGRALLAARRFPESLADLDAAFELANTVYGSGNAYARSAVRHAIEAAEQARDAPLTAIWLAREQAMPPPATPTEQR